MTCGLVTALSGVCAGAAALQFNGTSNRVDVATALISDDITMSVWVKATTPWVNDTRIPLSNSYWGAAASRVGFHIMVQANGMAASRYQTQADGVGVWSVTGTTNITGAWHHLTYVKEGTKISIVVDGKEEASRNDMPASVAGLAILNQIRIGCNTSNARFFAGLIDEVRIWNHARSLAQIQESMSHQLFGTEEGLVGYWKLDEGQGTTVFDSSLVPHDGTIVGATWATDVAPVAGSPIPASAYGAAPASEATDVPHDVVLGWKPGRYAGKHDVYLGTVLADVEAASRTDAKGVLAGQAQDANTFDPTGVLDFNTTYYWRVDEVNTTPDNTIYKGSVWSFTTEPFAYPIANVTATAAGSQPGMGPENAVGGVGLNASDQHSTLETEMWMSSSTGPRWIQFAFDQAYKLDELWVWNSNQMIEGFVGFGAKGVTIEYSLDGEAWTVLEGVPEFARANGLPTYTADTIIDFGGATAQYVRLTIDTSWGGLPQAGLSEVRFFYIPVQAREPMPADGAADVALDTELDWRPGREATSHVVFFGTDAQAVADGTAASATVTDHGYAPVNMGFGTTYYWKVNEVGDAGTYESDVWSFTTGEYATIEDFESYTDDVEAQATIWHTWIDGLTDKQSGSQVGYDMSPFAEQTIVHGGEQAMPFMYDNTVTPFFSEAYREFAPAQNWTIGAADTLVLYVQGRGADFGISSVATPPAIDGAIDAAWANAAALPLDTLIDGAALTGSPDASGQFRVLYDATNLYVLVEINDDQLKNDSTAAYLDDSVEVYIDGDNTKGQSPLAGLARQYTFGWSDTAIAGTNTDTTGVQLAQANTPTGWRIEIKFPWQALVGAGAPVGKLIGIDCFYNDDDDGGDTRESQVAWHSLVGNDWQTPASWGTAMVAAAGAGASADRFYVALQDTSNRSATVAYPGPEILRAGWNQWQIPLADFASAGVRLNAVKKLTIGVGDKAAPKAGGAGTIYVDDIAFGHPASGQ